MKPATFALVALVAALCLLPGCKKKQEIKKELDYETELAPGQMALRKITDPNEIPDFSRGFAFRSQQERDDLVAAIDQSIRYLGHPSSGQYFPYLDVTHERAVASLRDFRNLLSQPNSPAELNRNLRTRYDTYVSVGCDSKGTVRYTAYYTPVFDASKTRQGQFQYPLYKLPANAATDEKGSKIALGGKTRQQIEQGNLAAGNELVYLADPFEAYIVQVQGSAKLRLVDEGNREAVFGYAGYNGLEYHSVRQEMLDDGVLSSGKASLQGMIQYFKAHPNDVQKYTWKNPRYVFFAESTDPTPRGCLNVPVTTLRSLATDKGIFPRACMSFMDVSSMPQRRGSRMVKEDYKGFILDQDTGGGIRKAGRADIYMGVGEGAGIMAGHCVQDGKLYYVFLKPEHMAAPAAPVAATTAPAVPQ